MYFVFVFVLLLFSSVNVTDNKKKREDRDGRRGRRGTESDNKSAKQRVEQNCHCCPPQCAAYVMQNVKSRQLQHVKDESPSPTFPLSPPLSLCLCWCAVWHRVAAIEYARQAGTSPPPPYPLRFIQLKTSLPVLAFNLIDRWTWTIEENTQNCINLIWRCCYTLYRGVEAGEYSINCL